MNPPLSGFAASPQGDDALAAGRPLLGIPGLGRVGFGAQGQNKVTNNPNEEDSSMDHNSYIFDSFLRNTSKR